MTYNVLNTSLLLWLFLIVKNEFMFIGCECEGSNDNKDTNRKKY